MDIFFNNHDIFFLKNDQISNVVVYEATPI